MGASAYGQHNLLFMLLPITLFNNLAFEYIVISII
jgi:hypothetical protein